MMRSTKLSWYQIDPQYITSSIPTVLPALLHIDPESWVCKGCCEGRGG